MWNFIAKNADAISASATVLGVLVAIIAFCVTIYNVKDTARTVANVVETWKRAQNPSFCIERQGRLADDGKNFSHEDLIVSNLGRAPKSIRGIKVREYHVATVMKGFEIRTFVFPIWFYQYGSYSQQLIGRVYTAVGNNARETSFNFDVAMRAFLKSKGWGYYSSTKVVVCISFVDAFGDEKNEYFDVESVGGHSIISKEEFEGYGRKAGLLYKMSPIKLDLSKVDPNKVWDAWILPDVPQKIVSHEDVE